MIPDEAVEAAICDRCDKDRHICKGCGGALRHDELRLDGSECDCHAS
jgi:hypothetical protein